MQLNDIIIVSVMVSNAYTITDTDPILSKMTDTDIRKYISGISASLLKSYR